MGSLSYQVANFTYPGIPRREMFDQVVAQAKEADAAGFDRLTVMDHFYQVPGIASYDEPMIEAYSLLSALAQHTTNLRLCTLVTGNTYRNPAMLAKVVTALDLVSHGRATLGIGAGWLELEHEAMGYEFGTFSERFERLEEALQIVIPLLRGEKAKLNGKHYQVVNFINSPPPLSRIPVVIGGSGEDKTLRMVAQYADESNLVGIRRACDVAPKLEALERHCKRLGRDRSEIAVTLLVPTNIAPTMEDADAALRKMMTLRGQPEELFDSFKSRLAHGDPDIVGEQLEAFVGAGLDGLALSQIVAGHVAGRVSMLADVARGVVGPSERTRRADLGSS